MKKVHDLSILTIMLFGIFPVLPFQDSVVRQVLHPKMESRTGKDSDFVWVPNKSCRHSHMSQRALQISIHQLEPQGLLSWAILIHLNPNPYVKEGSN